MAGIEDVVRVRLMVAEPDETTFTDETIGALLDAVSVTALPLVAVLTVAQQIWLQKAAIYSDLVDISEGGSSRKNGDLHKRALLMAEVYGAQILAVSDLRATRIARLTR